jgi:hypothetical protein
MNQMLIDFGFADPRSLCLRSASSRGGRPLLVLRSPADADAPDAEEEGTHLLLIALGSHTLAERYLASFGFPPLPSYEEGEEGRRFALGDPSDLDGAFHPSAPSLSRHAQSPADSGVYASGGANGERGRAGGRQASPPSVSSSTRAPRRGCVLRWGWGGRWVRLARRLLRVSLFLLFLHPWARL